MLYYAQSWRMEAVSANGGGQALAILREHAQKGIPFDVAILDMEMPGMDGIELAQLIKADPNLCHTKLVLLTSIGCRRGEALVQQGRFDGYITKPVRKHDLQNCLGLVMGRLDLNDGSDSSLLVQGHELREPELVSFSGYVLVVDDHLVNQQLAEIMLQRLGHRVDIVGNGLEAVEAVNRIPYDLVLMDCYMPELDGYEAARRIRNAEAARLSATREWPQGPSGLTRPRRVPIVAMTANAMQGDRERCLEAGMNDYITKPIKFYELGQMVEKWLPQENSTPDLSEDRVTSSLLLLEDPTEKKGRRDSSSDNPLHEGNRQVQDLLDTRLLADWHAMGGKTFIAKLVNQFIQDVTVCVTDLHTALDSQDGKALLEAAHGIKGMAKNMGLTELAVLASQLESLGQQNDLQSVALLLESFHIEFSRAQKTFQRILETQ